MGCACREFKEGKLVLDKFPFFLFQTTAKPVRIRTRDRV